jgi:hypothetical protein
MNEFDIILGNLTAGVNETILELREQHMLDLQFAAVEEVFSVLETIAEPLNNIPRYIIKEKIEWLKSQDGECYAIAKCLENIQLHLEDREW